MSRKVLIVEDADVCAAALEMALSRVPGLVVLSATTAEEALEVMLKGDISAVITDIHLPGMDGFELIEKLRSQARFVHLPILVISGDSDPITPAKLQGLGANAYFPKPYSPAEVRKRLEQLIDA